MTSRLRLRRTPARVLLAHDAQATSCDRLITELGNAGFHVTGIASVAAGLAILRPSIPSTDASFGVDVVLSCLDLPPAPRGGALFADAARRVGLPVVLVTRSLRWVPEDLQHLRDLPWVTPDADQAVLLEAVRAAVDATDVQGAPSGIARLSWDEPEPERISWVS